MCWTALYSLTYPATPERRELAHFVGAGNRAAENQNRQPAVVELADAAYEIHPCGVGQPQIDDEQIDVRQVRAHAGEQLGGASYGDRTMTGTLECGFEAVPDECRVIGNQDGFHAGCAGGHEEVELS